MKCFLIITVLYLSVYTSQAQLKFPLSELPKNGTEMVCVAFNPDGRMLASADQKGNIYLWDVESKNLVNTLSGKQSKVLSIAFSHDGNFLAAANYNHSITVWSARHGVEVKTLKGHTETITKMTFSADNKILASGSADNKIIIWNFTEGSVLHTITDHTKEVSSLSFTLDGKLLASAGFDGMVYFWNTETWKAEKKISPGIGRVRSIAISPDSKFVALGTEKKGTHLFEIYTSYLYKTLPDQKEITNDLQFSADGKYLFTGAFDFGIKVFDVEKGESVASLGSFYHFNSLHINSRGNWLAVADYSPKVKLYNISDLKIKALQQGLIVNTSPLASEIIIELLEPAVPFDSVFFAQSNKVSIKGTVTAKNGISELRINNEVVNLSANGFFQYEARIPLGQWFIPIVAKDFNNQTVTKRLVTQRSGNANEESTIRDGRDLALIIATDRYDELTPLNNPVFDGTTIKSDLEELYGFETNLLINPSKSQILEEIRNYSKRQYARGDQLFIFVAGHGEYDEIFKQGYLAGRDSRKKDEVKQSYISYADFRDYINSIPCKHIMVVLDVCYGGTINQVVASRGQTDYTDIDRDLFIMNKLKYTSRRYITSGGKQYVSDGIKDNHSPFARRFIEALRSNGGTDGILTFNEMFSFVEKVEPGPTSGEFGSNEPGSDFLLISKQKK